MKTTTGTYSPQRQYIGQYYDTDTSLNYLNARYYDSERGQFVSEDPVFWEIGLTQDGKTILSNPQLANSYSYAGDNPVNGKDPEGRFIETGFDIAMLAMSLNAYNNDSSLSNAVSVFLDGAATLVPGVPAVGGMVVRGVRTVEKSTDVSKIAKKLQFGQSSVSPTFGSGEKNPFRGQSLESVTQGLREGVISADALPIKYVERNGVPITINNRSLKVLRDAGVLPTKVENVTGRKQYEGILNEHLKGGNPASDIKIRGKNN